MVSPKFRHESRRVAMRKIIIAFACSRPAASTADFSEGKPAPLAAAVSTPKKSIDATPKLGEAEASTEAAAVATAAPARTGSASSDSADDKKKAKSKSRSVSRGKRSSIFGSFLGKKDKAEEKKEEKKDEAEAKKEEEAVAPVAESKFFSFFLFFVFVRHAIKGVLTRDSCPCHPRHHPLGRGGP